MRECPAKQSASRSFYWSVRKMEEENKENKTLLHCGSKQSPIPSVHRKTGRKKREQRKKENRQIKKLKEMGESIPWYMCKEIRDNIIDRTVFVCFFCSLPTKTKQKLIFSFLLCFVHYFARRCSNTLKKKKQRMSNHNVFFFIFSHVAI